MLGPDNKTTFRAIWALIHRVDLFELHLSNWAHSRLSSQIALHSPEEDINPLSASHLVIKATNHHKFVICCDDYEEEKRATKPTLVDLNKKLSISISKHYTLGSPKRRDLLLWCPSFLLFQTVPHTRICSKQKLEFHFYNRLLIASMQMRSRFDRACNSDTTCMCSPDFSPDYYYRFGRSVLCVTISFLRIFYRSHLSSQQGPPN